MPGGIRDAAGALIAKDPGTLPPDEFDFDSLWRHPNLLFAQTCWGPLELWLGASVHVIAQDDYTGVEGGRGALYSSAIVMRKTGGESPHAAGSAGISPAKGDIVRKLSGLRFAYNVADSMSGYLALERDLAAEGSSLDVFKQRIISGGHRKSIRMVAEGLADVAAIDCVSWKLALQHEPAAHDLMVAGWTTKRKGLPFITARR